MGGRSAEKLGKESKLLPTARGRSSRLALKSQQTATNLMETRDSLRRVPQMVVSLLELINQAIHTHPALHKQTVKVSRDALKFDQIGLRWRLDSSHYFVSTETRCRIPDDCIDSKRYPLFMARAVLQELIESLQSTQGVKPC